ncbi:MAG: hypothetical protein ACYCW6_09560 [Candidatus Xenobia bacterium]
MTRILSRLLVLAALVVVLLCLCEGVLRVTVPGTIFDRKLTLIEQHDLSDTRVAVFGTSRAYQGIDPRYLQWKSYNFSDLGESFYQSCELLERWTPRMPQLRGVILVLDEFGFGNVEDPTVSVDYERHGYPAEFPSLRMRLEEKSALVRYRRDLLPILMARLMGKSHYEVKPIVPDNPDPTVMHQDCVVASTGLLWVPPTVRQYTEDMAAQRAQVRWAGYFRQYRTTNIHLLERFIRDCQARRLRLLLVRTPMPQIYRDAVSPQMLAEFQSDLQSALTDCGSAGVKVKSYWDAPGFTPIEFADIDHLGSAGAHHFSQLLSHDVAGYFNDAHVADRP